MLDVTVDTICQENKEDSKNLFNEKLLGSDSGLMIIDQDGGIECHVCSDKFTWSAHVKRRHSEALFSCEHCVNNFILESDLKRHISLAHIGGRIRCDYCQLTYIKRDTLVKHTKKSHKDRMYPCEDCGKLFVTEDILKRHVLSHLDKSRTGSQISCEHCKVTCYREALHRHMKKNHCDKMFPCTACGKHFVLEKNLKNHILSAHEGTRFQCDQCPKEFATKSVLTVHVKNAHTECLFVCPQCPSTFRYDHNLKRHIKKFHDMKLLD